MGKYDSFLDGPSSAGKYDAFLDEGTGQPAADPDGGFAAAAKQAIGQTIKGAGQAAADFIPGVSAQNPITQYGQSVVDANQTAVRSFGGIADSPWTAVKEAVGNAAGSMGAMLGARAIGTGITAAAPFAGPAAPVVAGAGQLIANVGPIAASMLPSYSGIRETQIKVDPNNEADAKSKAIAALGAATVGAIETKFGPQGWALAAMKKGGFDALKQKLGADTLRGAIGKGIAKGSAIEGAEELVQNPIEQLSGYQNPTTKEAIQETAFGGAMGAIGGGVIGGGVGGIAHFASPPVPKGPLQKAADAATTTPSTIPQEAGQGIPQEEGVPPATIQAGIIPQAQQPATGIAAAVQNTPAAPGTPFVPVSTAAPPPTTAQAEPAGVPISQPQEGAVSRGNETEVAQPAEPGQQAQSAQAADSAAAEQEWQDFVASEGRDIGIRQLAVLRRQFMDRRRRASGIEEATGRVEAARQREVAANRMAVLESLPLTTTGNTIRRFAAALRNAGIRDYRVSPEERQMIARRIDARDTLQPLEQEPENELTLPEKREANSVAPTVPRMDALRRKMATPGARIVGNRLLDRHGKRLDTLSAGEAQELAPKKQQAPKKTVASDELDAFIKEEAANLGKRRSMLLSLQAIRKQKQSEDDRADLDALIEAERADLLERRARLQDAHAAAREKKPFVVPPLRTPEQPTTGGRPIEQQATALPLGEFGKRATVDAIKTPPRGPQQPLSAAGEQQNVPTYKKATARSASHYRVRLKTPLGNFDVFVEKNKDSSLDDYKKDAKNAFAADSNMANLSGIAQISFDGSPEPVSDVSDQASVAKNASWARIAKAEKAMSPKMSPDISPDISTDIYDKEGFNRKGYNRDGFNRKGFDKYGYDEDGFDADGFDAYGIKADDDFYMSDTEIARFNSAIGFRIDEGAGGWPVKNDYIDNINTEDAYAVADKQGFMYRGLNRPDTQADITKDGDLVLVSGVNFDEQTTGISFTPFLDIAKDYATRTQTAAVRHPDGAIVKIDMAALRRIYLEEEGDGEFAFYDKEELTIPSGAWEITYNPDAEGPFTLVAKTKNNPAPKTRPARPSKKTVPLDVAGSIIGKLWQTAVYNKLKWPSIKARAVTQLVDVGASRPSVLAALDDAMTEFARNANGRLGYPNETTTMRALIGRGVVEPESEQPKTPPGQDVNMQNRDRSRAASVVQMSDIARNPDYMRLGPSRTPDSGAPMVFAAGDDLSRIPKANFGREDVSVMSDGQRVPFRYAVVDASQVEPSNFADGRANPEFSADRSGTIKALNNGRVAGLRAAYEIGSAGAYQAELASDLANVGISPGAMRATPNPILVRVYSDTANTSGMAAKSQAQGLGMSPAELARQDAPLLDSSVLDVLRPGDIAAADNRDFVRAFVGKLRQSGQDIAGMMTDSGSLSSMGRQRINAALMQAAYGDADLVAELFDSIDTDIKAIGDALKSVAGAWANMRDSAKLGSIAPEADITEPIVSAVRLIQKARRDRLSLSDLVNQRDIETGEAVDDLTAGALRLFYTGQNMTRPTGKERLVANLERYLELAMATSAGADMFGDKADASQLIQAITKDDTDAGNKVKAEPSSMPSAGPGPGRGRPEAQRQRGAAGGNQPLKSGGQGKGGQEAVIVPQVVAPDTPRPELGLLGQTPEEVAAADIAAKKAKHDELIAKATASRKEKAAKDKAEKDRRAADVLKEREAAKKVEVDKAAEEFALGQAAPDPVVKKVTTEDARGQEDFRFSFAGQQSATADQFQLARAKQLLAVGASADGVRQQTGWFKGVDGKWRYEIDDSGASLQNLGMEDGRAMRATSLEIILDHPALFAAYPELRDMDVQITIDPNGQERGSLERGSAGDSQTFGRQPEIKVNARTEEKALSTLLHEIQHGIQNVEGFASGGNMDQFVNPILLKKADLERRVFAINALLRKSKGNEYLELLDDRAALVDEISRLPDDIGTLEQGYKQYRKLAGEVEARSVQRRQNFTADRRKYSDPIGTQDVAAEDVIVMFNGKDAKDAPAPANTTRASAMAAIGASPADAAVFDMATEGKSAQEILSFLSKSSRRPFNRVLANALSRIGVSSNVSVDQNAGWRNVQNRQGARFAASYSPKTDTVSLFTPREAERHILHEFVHPATMTAIARGGPAARQMQAIFDYVQKTGTMSDQYGMGNFSRFPNETDAQFKKRALDEFVAELFTNHQFRFLLKQLLAPPGSKLKSVWDWIVRVIANILGMRTKALETALDRALSVGVALLQENADLTMPKGETARYHTTWHGSPHKFYTFDLSKIGTGEGAQAYGHGLYVAEAPDVALQYSNMRAAPNMEFYAGKRKLTGLEKSVADDMTANGKVVARINAKANGQEWLAAYERIANELVTRGIVYKVDLPAEAIARMLDWDAALSNQPPEVQSALKDAGIADVDKWTDAGLKGRELYNRAKRGAPVKLPLNQSDDQAFASERLKQAGVTGIRYLDQQSRSGEKSTSNFVLFDDKLARIIEVNGVETGVQPWATGEWDAAQGGERFSQANHGTDYGVLFHDKNENAVVWAEGDYRVTVNKPGNASLATLWAKQTVNGKEHWGKRGSLNTFESRKIVDGNADNWLRIQEISIEKEHRGKGLAKHLYNALLHQAAPDVRGILSHVPSITNKREVPALHTQLGAVTSADGDFKMIYRPAKNDGNPFDGREVATTPLKPGTTTLMVDGTERPALNSNGKPIHWSEEGVRNFWRWFKNSAVNDDQGRPLVLFHGASADFGENGAPVAFDFSRTADEDLSSGKGAYLTTSAEAASKYSAGISWGNAGQASAPNVMPVYARIEAPFSKTAIYRIEDFESVLPEGVVESAKEIARPGEEFIEETMQAIDDLNSKLAELESGFMDDETLQEYRIDENDYENDDDYKAAVEEAIEDEVKYVTRKIERYEGEIERAWSDAKKEYANARMTGAEIWDAIKKDLPEYTDWKNERQLIGGDTASIEMDTEVARILFDAFGFDGVKRTDTFPIRANHTVYIANNAPDQIKSATANTGAFSEDPDIRYSLATNWQQSPIAPGNLYQAAKKKAASLLTPERIDKLIYEMQDKFIDLRRIRDHIKEIGGTITDLNDAYLGEELYHKRLAHRTEQFLKEELQPFFSDMKARGVTMPEFEKFLHARHAPEANQEMEKRNPNQKQIDAGRQKSAATVRLLELKLQTAKARGLATVAIEKALNDARAELVRWNGAQAFKGTEEERLSLSGMSTDKANKLIDSMTPEQRADMNALAAKVDAINEGTLQALERYGLMDKAALNTWRNTYQHYVPLHRDEAHPDSASHPIGQGFNVRGDASKRRTGSNQEVTNIFGHIAMQREAALTRGEKNRVMQKLYLMARQNPIADIWSVGKVPMIDTIDKATGFVRSVPDPQYKDKPNVVTLRIGGKDVAIVMNEYNPQALRMAQSIKNLDVDDLHYLIPVVGKATRWFASINTQYNPIFGLINFARDVQTAALNLSTTEIAGKQKEVFKDTMSILGDIIKNKGRMPTAGKWAPIYKEFNEVGGTTGYRDLFLTAEDRSKAVADEIKALDRGKVSQVAHAVAGWLSDYNEAMENATRLAAYKAAIDNGMSKERAASLAKNLTVNFNRKGRQTRELGALYAFFNAAVQGTARMAQTLSGPAGKKIMLGGVLAGAASAMAGIAAMGGGDGEDDEWSKIPEFVKERSLIIPSPFSKEGYFTIPMPLGFHFLPNIGRLMVEMAVYKDKTAGKQMASLFTVLADAFNPLGGSAPPMQIIAPTVMDPFVALAQNKDWTGKPIYVENFNSLNPQPGAERAKDSATPIAKGMADAINAVTGGTKYVPGAWSPTPDQIDYVIGQLTGGVGRELGKLSSTIAAPFTGDELPAHKIPLLGRLYGSTSGASGQAEKFYANIKRSNEAENEIKGRRKDGISVDDYLQDNPKAVELAARGNAAERQIRALRQMRSRIVEAGGDDATSKARQINERMATVMRSFNMQVERMQ